jgi:DHA1 family inner membrane transport protein
MMSRGDAEGSPGHETASDRRRAAAVLLVLAAVQFTNIVDFMIVMPLGPQLMRRLAISPEQFGLIVSSYTFSACVAGLLAALFIDRFDRKRAFLTLYLGFLVGTLACGLSTGYPALIVARIATGAFGGILAGMAMAIIGDVFPEERRGSATGILMSAFAVASVVGVPFGLYLGERLDWHAPFFVLAGLGAVVLPVGARALPTLRGHLRAGSAVHSPLAEMRSTMVHPNHVRAFALVVSMMFGGFLVIPFISPYLVSNVGVAEINLPWVYMVGGGMTLVAAPIIGRLADRFGKLQVYRVVAPFSAALMLAVTNLRPVPLPWAIGVVAALMVANAGRMVVAMAMVTGCVEPRQRGSFMSINSSVQNLSTGLGAFVAGRIVDRTAEGSLTHFREVGYLAVAATILSIYLAGRVRSAGTGTHPATLHSRDHAADPMAPSAASQELA